MNKKTWAERYQIPDKAHYINLIVLKDELQQLDMELSRSVSEPRNLLARYRATRNVFLTLNNIFEALSRVRIIEPNDLVQRTRKLRIRLDLAKHFRHKGIGHLDVNLLQRAAQWHPNIFNEDNKSNEELIGIETQRAVIEACINSFIDENGNQKTFGTEIDLMYPPDAELFFSYLYELAHEALCWLDEAAKILQQRIEYHTESDLIEMAAVAGQTNFNLYENEEPRHSKEEHRLKVSQLLEFLEKSGAKEEVSEFVRQELQV